MNDVLRDEGVVFRLLLQVTGCDLRIHGDRQGLRSGVEQELDANRNN